MEFVNYYKNKSQDLWNDEPMKNKNKLITDHNTVNSSCHVSSFCQGLNRGTTIFFNTLQISFNNIDSLMWLLSIIDTRIHRTTRIPSTRRLSWGLLNFGRVWFLGPKLCCLARVQPFGFLPVSGVCASFSFLFFFFRGRAKMAHRPGRASRCLCRQDKVRSGKLALRTKCSLYPLKVQHLHQLFDLPSSAGCSLRVLQNDPAKIQSNWYPSRVKHIVCCIRRGQEQAARFIPQSMLEANTWESWVGCQRWRGKQRRSNGTGIFKVTTILRGYPNT